MPVFVPFSVRHISFVIHYLFTGFCFCFCFYFSSLFNIFVACVKSLSFIMLHINMQPVAVMLLQESV